MFPLSFRTTPVFYSILFLYFSKHIKFVEINKIPNISLKSQNIIIDSIDICGYDDDGYMIEAEENNSYFVFSIRGELIFDVPKSRIEIINF